MCKEAVISVVFATFVGCTTNFDLREDDGDADAPVDDTGTDSGNSDPSEEEDGVEACTWFYFDADHDGYGREDSAVCLTTPLEGYVTSSGDCCDELVDVHPAQTGWFAVPYSCPSLSWDYNCDGANQLEFPLDPCPDLEGTCSSLTDADTCRGVPCCYSATEFGTPLPACGTLASIWRCGWQEAPYNTCVTNRNLHGGCAEYGGGGEQFTRCH